VETTGSNAARIERRNGLNARSVFFARRSPHRAVRARCVVTRVFSRASEWIRLRYIEPLEVKLGLLREQFNNESDAQEPVRRAIRKRLERFFYDAEVEFEHRDLRHCRLTEVGDILLEADELWPSDGELSLEGVTEVEVFLTGEHPHYGYSPYDEYDQPSRDLSLVAYVEVVWRATVYDYDLANIEAGDVDIHRPHTVRLRRSPF
jgi:hypothetical protein